MKNLPILIKEFDNRMEKEYVVVFLTVPTPKVGELHIIKYLSNGNSLTKPYVTAGVFEDMFYPLHWIKNEKSPSILEQCITETKKITGEGYEFHVKRNFAKMYHRIREKHLDRLKCEGVDLSKLADLNFSLSII